MEKPVVLIMAGGKGERFWPRSREKSPKQLQKVYSHRTLLEETLVRARGITDSSRIFIGCNGSLKKAILASHKGIKPENFVVEPEGRNTAPIVALAALQLERKFPGSVQVVMSADHFISPVQEFKKTITRAYRAAREGWLVTLGVPPSRPETGYGYIEAGKEMAGLDARSIHSFVEKPDLNRAMKYIKRENYYWNSGIFIWSGETILSEFRQHAPEILDPLEKSYRSTAALKKSFQKIPSQPVDIAILEKSKKIAMVPATFTWDDVGSWLSLERISRADRDGNILSPVEGKGELFVHDATGNIVSSSHKLVAMLGVHDLILVEDDGVLFVSSRSSVSEIKSMMGRMRENPSLQKYLK